MKTKDMIGFFVIFSLAMILLFAAVAYYSEQTPFRQNKNIEGWELVGDKDGCKLYVKQIGKQQRTVYWSICNKEGRSTAVAY